MAINGKEWKELSLYSNREKLYKNFIIAWLPVDDKSLAKDTNQVVFWYGKQRPLKTVGDQYKYFEEITFNTSTQPMFCFIDTAKKPLGISIGYTLNKKEVNNFIENGLKSK